MLQNITALLRYLGAFFLTLLLLSVIVVILDTKLQWNAVWASSLSTFLLAWTIMIGGALAYAEQQHLGLDILVEHLEGESRQWAKILGHLVVLCFSLSVVLYGGWTITMKRWEMGQMIPSLNISQAWFYCSLPLAGVLMSLTALAHLFSVRKEGATL